MRFETVQSYFFLVNFGFVVILKFCYHGNVTYDLPIRNTDFQTYYIYNR